MQPRAVMNVHMHARPMHVRVPMRACVHAPTCDEDVEADGTGLGDDAGQGHVLHAKRGRGLDMQVGIGGSGGDDVKEGVHQHQPRQR